MYTTEIQPFFGVMAFSFIWHILKTLPNQALQTAARQEEDSQVLNSKSAKTAHSFILRLIELFSRAEGQSYPVFSILLWN
jgi:hypothetical protein